MIDSIKNILSQFFKILTGHVTFLGFIQVDKKISNKLSILDNKGQINRKKSLFELRDADRYE